LAGKLTLILLMNLPIDLLINFKKIHLSTYLQMNLKKIELLKNLSMIFKTFNYRWI